jgi:hypothetical protein
MLEVIEIIFCEEGKAPEKTLPVSSNMKLGDFREAAQILMSLPENSSWQLVLERTREVLRNELNFADAGIKHGDKLILVPKNSRDFMEGKSISSSSGMFSRVQEEKYEAKALSLVKYKLQLTIPSDGHQTDTYDYPIELTEFYEDNPQRFFSDANSQEKQNFVTQIQEKVPRQIQTFEIDKILQQWCEDISLGYRTTGIRI